MGEKKKKYHETLSSTVYHFWLRSLKTRFESWKQFLAKDLGTPGNDKNYKIGQSRTEKEEFKIKKREEFNFKKREREEEREEMDFERLLRQLSDLETAKRREECKFAEEKTASQAKEAEVRLLSRELDSARARIGELGEETAALRVEEKTLRATCEQLAEAAKSAREETRMTKASVEEEVKETRRKREELTNTLKSMVRDIREQQIRYQNAIDRAEGRTQRPRDSPMATIGCPVLTRSKSSLGRDNEQGDQVQENQAETIGKLEVRLAEMEAKEAATSAEFGQLEDFASKVDGMFRRLREQVRGLKGFTCPGCGAGFDAAQKLGLDSCKAGDA